jgi:acyl CoA:acetate/3-ketoacid CoA transferase alpha subunit
MNMSTRAVELSLYKHSGLTDSLRSTAMGIPARKCGLTIGGGPSHGPSSSPSDGAADAGK